MQEIPITYMIENGDSLCFARYDLDKNKRYTYILSNVYRVGAHSEEFKGTVTYVRISRIDKEDIGFIPSCRELHDFVTYDPIDEDTVLITITRPDRNGLQAAADADG